MTLLVCTPLLPAQTNLFEDPVMTMSRVGLGAEATIGCGAVVFYDAVAGPGASLVALSLVMKGRCPPGREPLAR